MRTELTLQEILDIAQTVATQSTYIERKMVKDILVLETLSGEEISDKLISVELYETYRDKIDAMYENCTNDGLIDAQVNSILENNKMEIYKEVKETISKALENVNVAIDNYTKNAESKGVDLQGLLAQMKEVK
jgi:hypothetical protein